MQSKRLISYLWCLWLGYFLGGLVTPVNYDVSWPTEVVRQVTQNHAAAYAKVCRIGFFSVLIITICIAVVSKVLNQGQRKGASPADPT